MTSGARTGVPRVATRIGLVRWMRPTTPAVALLITGLAVRLKPAGEGEV